MEVIVNPVKRERFFASVEDFAKHLEFVGKAIMEDAKTMNLNPYNICSVYITVEIAPDTELTNIKYEINRRADLRIDGGDKNT